MTELSAGLGMKFGDAPAPPSSPVDRLSAIRDRAERLNLSFRQLMQKAGVVPSTFYRWENGDTQRPHAHRYEALVQKLDAALVAEEERLLQELLH